VTGPTLVWLISQSCCRELLQVHPLDLSSMYTYRQYAPPLAWDLEVCTWLYRGMGKVLMLQVDAVHVLYRHTVSTHSLVSSPRGFRLFIHRTLLASLHPSTAPNCMYPFTCHLISTQGHTRQLAPTSNPLSFLSTPSHTGTVHTVHVSPDGRLDRRHASRVITVSARSPVNLKTLIT